MRSIRTRRGYAAAAGGVGLALALAACSSGGDSGSNDAAGGGDDATSADCAAYEQYGDLSGKEISVYTSIVAPEDQPHIDSYVPFEECTGAKVNYEGSKEFEAQLQVRLASGNPPDIAYIPQPGLLRTLVTNFPEDVKAAPQPVIDNVDEYFTAAWKAYGSVDETLYASPLGANVKSFVWYSPAAFEDAGYEIPTTWDELIDLSDQIVKDGGKPWCAGIGSGDATGWPVTDWLEDVLLRTAGPEVYDQWVTHEIPFNDPQVLTALEQVGEILRNDDYVNGGLGDVTSIASTTFQDAGLPIIDGTCWMHRQASFYQANWPEGTTVAEDGDVYAFYLPGESADDKPLLGGGEFVAAFSDRPEVQAFQAYLSSPEWANAKAEATGQGWLSANSGLDGDLLQSPIDKLSFDLLTDESYTFRFDGSDQMPGEVGSGSFWTEATNWIANGKDDKAVLDAIEASWPTS
jgi:alpha-glucoside transport system substrate-binding protein